MSVSLLRLEERCLWKLKFGKGKKIKNLMSDKEEEGMLFIRHSVIRKTKKLRTGNYFKSHQAPLAATTNKVDN